MAVLIHESNIVELTLELARELLRSGNPLGATLATVSTDGGGSLRDFLVFTIPSDMRKAFRCDALLKPFGLREFNDEYPVIITLQGKQLTVRYDKHKVHVRFGIKQNSHTFA